MMIKAFRYTTLPNIKWGLLYGVILCNARATLHVEILYNEYNYAAAFAVASLLAVLAIITLGLKTLVERQTRRQLQDIDTPSGE
jgi:sulfate transport system permease protein